MARKVDFRNDVYTLGSGIGDDFANLVLAEPASFSVWSAVVFVTLEDMADDGLFSD